MNTRKSIFFHHNGRQLGKSLFQENYCEAKIMGQREEILRAFIAKYGCQPDEAIQIIEHSPDRTVWYVKKKGEVGQGGEPSGL